MIYSRNLEHSPTELRPTYPDLNFVFSNWEFLKLGIPIIYVKNSNI